MREPASPPSEGTGASRGRPCLARLARTLAVVSLAAGAAPPALAQDMAQPLPPPPGAEQAPAPRAPVLTRAPVLLKEPAPVYPPDALAARLSADVELTIDIGADGRVTKAAVAEGAGHGFDEAALDAARVLEFTPAEVDGRPSPIRIEFVLHFRPPELPPEDAPPAEPAPAPPPLAALPPAPPPRLILRGHIREKGTREPIPGASVLVIRRAATPGAPDPAGEEVAESDESGAFEVRADAPAGARIVVAESAHESCVRDLTEAETHADPAHVAEWTCYALPAFRGFESRVRGKRTPAAASHYEVTGPALTSVPGTFNDPLRVISNLPGVARAPYGQGLLVVRGAPPTDTGAFVAGQAIPQIFHFLVGPSVLAPHLIERIDFFPGGFGARYGRVSGGVIDVGLKEAPTPALHGGADVGVLDASIYAEGGLADGVSATAAVRRSTIDAVLPHIIPQRDGSTFRTVVPVYWDYQARVIKELPSGGRVGVLAFGSQDSLRLVSQDPEAGDLALDSHSAFHRVVAFWTTRVGGWTSRLSPTWGMGDDSFTLGGGSAFIRYQRLYLREELTGQVARRLDVRLGFDGLLSYDTAYFDSWYSREGRNFGTGALQKVTASRRLIDWAPAVYAELEWRPIDRVRLIPGLRFDHYHVLGQDKLSLDPRLNVRVEVAPGWVAKGSAGLYHQLPVGQFLDKEFGNPNLSLIWTEQYSAGVERQLTSVWHVDAVAYFLRRHDLPIPSVERFSSTGRGRGWGLELLVKRELTEHFFGWLAYTLSWSEETAVTAQEAISGINGAPGTPEAPQAYRPSPFDQRHNLAAVASYKLGAWQLGARYRLVSGRPATAIDGAFYDADFGGYTPLATAAGRRLPTFSQLDVRVEHTFTFTYWTLGVYLDVQNVFNAQNPESTAYDYRYRDSSPVRGLPIFPVLGLRGRF